MLARCVGRASHTHRLARSRGLIISWQHGYCTDKPVRVRFAPSPTGELHLGGLRTALFNFLFARRHGGTFLVRIEDTDQSRTVPGAQERILSDLKWMGIEPDHNSEIRQQSQHTARYKEHAEQLLEKGHAYRCFCTAERLEELRQIAKEKGKPSFYDRKCMHLTDEQIQGNLTAGLPYTIRMRVPRNEVVTVKDMVYDTIKFECASVDDQILLKSDGFPTYHLASVVDDHHQEITHVIRGEEWMPSVPKHLLLYRFFGWTPPRFAHLPLLLNPDKSKLSKRQQASSLDWYRNEGFEKESILSYIAALGWTPPRLEGDEHRCLTSDELQQSFDLDGAHKSGAIVDAKKLHSINSYFLNQLATSHPDRLVDAAVQVLSEAVGFQLKERFPVEYITQVVLLCTSRMHRVREFERIAYFFQDPLFTSDESKAMREKVWTDRSSDWMKLLVEKLEDIPNGEFSPDLVSSKLKELCKEEKVKMGQVYPSFRYALTGSHVGAGIPETMSTMGKQLSVERLRKQIEGN